MSTGVAAELHVRLWYPRRTRRRHRTSRRRSKQVLQSATAIRVRTLRSSKLRARRKSSGIHRSGRIGVCDTSEYTSSSEAGGNHFDVLSTGDQTVFQKLSSGGEQIGGRTIFSGSEIDIENVTSEGICGQIERSDIEMRRMIETDEFMYAVANLDRCRDFVKNMRGCRLQISWPKGYIVVIRTESDLGIPMSEINRLSGEYLCCPEELVVIGGIQRIDADERAPFLAILFVGEETRIYLHASKVDDAMYLLGNDVSGFIKRGLRRFFPIYKEIGPGDYGIGFVDHIVPRSAISIAEFSANYPGTLFALPWPTGAILKIISPRTRLFAKSGGCCSMIYFAAVIGRYLSPIFREILLAVDENGNIFSYNPWEDGVTKVCRSLDELFAVGLRAVKKTYRFRTRFPPSFGDKPPQCPHVGIVPLPRDLYGDDSAMRCLCGGR